MTDILFALGVLALIGAGVTSIYFVLVKNKGKSSLSYSVIDDNLVKEKVNEIQEEMAKQLYPGEESLTLLRELLSGSQNMLVQTTKEGILLRNKADSIFPENSVKFSLTRDFMGLWRITVEIPMFGWEWEDAIRFQVTQSFPGLNGSDIRTIIRSSINDQNSSAIEWHWKKWITDTLSNDLGYVTLNSPWDIFSSRDEKSEEIIFCLPDADVNKFSAKGKPVEVYHQLLSFTNEMKRKLEKEYVDSIGFFSRKISDYLSETTLQNISVMELKGQSIIDLTMDQSFVLDASLTLDKNDFVLNLRLTIPEVELDITRLIERLEVNLRGFFSDYGKDVEIFDESFLSTGLIPNVTDSLDRDHLRRFGRKISYCYSFIMRIKEKDGNVHFGDSGETLDGSAEDQGS